MYGEYNECCAIDCTAVRKGCTHVQKQWVTAGIVGDGRLLATVSKQGELERVFWPTIDDAQQVNEFRMGLRIGGGALRILHEQEQVCGQTYEEGTNILQTMYALSDVRLTVTQLDYAVPTRNVLVRTWRIHNEGSSRQDVLGYTHTRMHVGGHRQGNAVRAAVAAQVMFHYRKDVTIGIASDRPWFGYQAGNTDAALESVKLWGQGETLGDDAAVAYSLGHIEPGQTAEWTVTLCFGSSQHDVTAQVHAWRDSGADVWLQETRAHWQRHLAQGTVIATGDAEIDRVYTRSLLAFGLLTDAVHGGLIAAPEFDPDYIRCGGYGYCWGRDAAYIATAITKAGYADVSDRFYDWVVRAQDADGKWDHRHYMNGTLAPSWGFQVDEPASILWGMWQQYQATKDKAFLARMWGSLQRGADFLVAFVDPVTGLPRESMDLWEERFAQHTYSAGAVCAALRAAVSAAHELGISQIVWGAWQTAADTIAAATSSRLWNAERQCLLRGTRLHVGGGHSGPRVDVEVDEMGYERWVQHEDPVVDASLLGLSYPFAVIAPDDPRAVQTAQAVREHLWTPGVGGIRRYENDTYIGGNPWILTTLWLGLEALGRDDVQTAQEMLAWATEHRTALDLLPEQIDRVTGETAWVVPLTWSHAMFVLLVHGLAECNVYTTMGKRSEPQPTRS